MRYPQMGTKGLVCPEFPWMIPQAVPAQGLQAVGLQIQIWKEFSSNRSKGFYLTDLGSLHVQRYAECKSCPVQVLGCGDGNYFRP